MNRRVALLLVILLFLGCFPAWGEKSRELTWVDLMPVNPLIEDPLAGLNAEQREMVMWLNDAEEALQQQGGESDQELIDKVAGMY